MRMDRALTISSGGPHADDSTITRLVDSRQLGSIAGEDGEDTCSGLARCEAWSSTNFRLARNSASRPEKRRPAVARSPSNSHAENRLGQSDINHSLNFAAPSAKSETPPFNAPRPVMSS